MIIKFNTDSTTPAGKLAEAEMHFAVEDGPLAGMKLVGFAVWERRGGGRNVTFPARQYSVNGERRSFALLRPIVDTRATELLRDTILAAFADFEDANEAHERAQEHAATDPSNGGQF
jgi:hypothetical protein